MPLCQKLLVIWNERIKWPVLNCDSSVLTQNEDIWNFHGSLTLNKWKLILYL